MEDGETVEVMVLMKRGSGKRNAKKGRKREILGISVARRKSGRRRGERRRGRMGESYQGGVERVGEEFHATGINSRNMAARAKREKREEMVGVRDVPVLGVETAVVKIVCMVEEIAREREKERNQKLLDEKDLHEESGNVQRWLRALAKDRNSHHEAETHRCLTGRGGQAQVLSLLHTLSNCHTRRFGAGGKSCANSHRQCGGAHATTKLPKVRLSERASTLRMQFNEIVSNLRSCQVNPAR